MLATGCGAANEPIVDNPERTARAAEDRAVERSEGYCVGWAKIRLDDASIDGLTDGDAEEILAHNLHGKAAGCWR